MTNFIDVLSVYEDRAKQMTEYLVDLNPRDYRDHAHWFSLMCECHHAGVDRKVFIDWCCRDPEYAGDAKVIARRWDSLSKQRRSENGN